VHDVLRFITKTERTVRTDTDGKLECDRTASLPASYGNGQIDREPYI
jgi:hypothetical protein